MTGQPFADCERGLACRESGLFTIPGAENTCQFAQLGEVCGGFDSETGESFPDCEDGLECRDAGLITIPGAGNTCQ